MPRKPRFFLPDIPVHAIQRGHNRAAVFFADQDYLEYLRCLKIAANDCDCQVHAYVLMTNHVHLLMTPASKESIGLLFQSLGRHYVRYINITYQRKGALWEGRYKAHLVQSQNYFLACMRYIEMNPVRAKLVKHPADYRWSSFAANALGVSNPIIQPQSEYLALGASPEVRQLAYRCLFDDDLKSDLLELFKNSLQSGTPMGDKGFKRQIEKTIGRKLGLLKQGRPTKES
jgi:putative transposase